MARRKSYEEKIAEHIAAIVQDRQIQHVLHFTRLENLPHILEHGLRSRSELANATFNVHASDPDRLDEEDDAVSVSISCYCPKMFDAKRHRAGDATWVILFLCPSLLWTLPCRFNAQGAATNAMKYENGSRHGGWALEKLFDEALFVSGQDDLRVQAGLPRSCPTFPNAEVQVMSAIHPEFIKETWVKASEDRDLVLADFAAAGREECEVVIHPFQPRISFRPWFWG